MEHLYLSPATQAVLKALAEVGEGTVHDLSEKSGKARSTTDKAIRTLTDAGLIVEIDTGADPAEGTPARWTLSEAAAAEVAAADLGDTPTAGPDEPDSADPDPEPSPTGDATPDTDTDADTDTDTDADADADERDDETGDGQDMPEDDKSHIDADNSSTSSQTSTDTNTENGSTETDNAAAVIVSSRPGDRKVMAIKGVLADHSNDGATLEVIVAESGISHPTTIRLLAAMEQADAARRLPGQPQRWITGPTKASDVDPNPEPTRCPLCVQVIRGVTSTPSAVAAMQPLIQPDGTLHVVGPDDEVHIVTLPTRTPPRTVSNPTRVGGRADVTVNADGSQPFGRGELEKLTIAVLAAHPGRPMTPQEIATAISAQLGGRTVSSGAVRNNCTKAAAAGSILLASETPLTFVFPASADDADAHTDDAAPAGAPSADTGIERA